jgi:thiol:disulfide interchange protein/DsbC/DsbD-like thiol-disulfide interchange protein
MLCGVLLSAGAWAQSWTPTGGSARLAVAQVDESAVVVSEFSRSSLLVLAPQGVAPGLPLWVGLRIEHAPEWHSYWKNPGDSGLPTELEWQLPAGVQAGEIVWPAPQKFPLGDLANYGYEDVLLLPVPLTVGPTFSGQSLNLEVLATWLICRKECVPEEASFRLEVPAGVSLARHAALFEQAWRAAPQSLAGVSGNIEVGADGLQLQVSGLPNAWRGQALELFPETVAVIEPGAPWQQRWQGNTWVAEVPLSKFRQDSPGTMPVVLTADGATGGVRAVEMVLPVSGDWPAVQVGTTAASEALMAALAENAARAAAQSNAPSITLWAALLGALVGGMILNLMPCVFPVLAIKVLAFSSHGQDSSAHRLSGLAYTAGVVLSFVALGGLLLALRAAGEQLGWGFQLQNPWVVAGLATLFTVIGLNLAGLFEVGNLLPSKVATLQAKNPTADAFLTGVLATAVASPCTAPFMGASLGLAIALPTGQALAVFAVLGLGMALPFWVASSWPVVARALPRPGAWMMTFKQLMAFPMFATTVWLLWVLGQQSGIDGAAVLLLMLVVLSLGLWTLGQSQRVRRSVGVAALLGLLWLGWAWGPYVALPMTDPNARTATTVEGVVWEPWSPDVETALREQGRPVFVDYTAAWCVTCQFNKNNALSDTAFLQAVRERGVQLLRADWTRRDPAITAALNALGRSGVPVYVLHRPGREPVVLSEILTVPELMQALQDL